MSTQTAATALTLDRLPTGEMAVVLHVGSDLLDLERLKVMGLCEGQAVKVMRSGERMIVCCCGTRIGMSQHLAKQITVQSQEKECTACSTPSPTTAPAQAQH